MKLMNEAKADKVRNAMDEQEESADGTRSAEELDSSILLPAPSTVTLLTMILMNTWIQKTKITLKMLQQRISPSSIGIGLMNWTERTYKWFP